MNAITAIDMETEISRSLYRYIFNRVTSRPHAELRHNVHLDPISGSSQLNSFTFDGTYYQLPYSGSWFVFLMDNRHVHHIRLPEDRTATTCLADRKQLNNMLMGYCTKHHIDVRIICSSTGRSIPRRHVFVFPASDQQFLFMISRTAIARYTSSAESSPTDLWINFYYHHTSLFKVTEYSSTDTYEIQRFLMKAINRQYHAYRNGYLIMEPNKLSINDIAPDDHLELVEDPDIVDYFDVEVKEDYLSDGYHTLFHIPKKMNPDNEIIGHGVCDIVLYKDGYKNEGIVLNRAQTKDYVQTLTHNDFGISTAFLRNYGSHINRPGALMARVYVRNHHRKDLTLTREANYTDCLYRLTDEQIVDHLLGKLDVPCWTAASLAQSAYAKILDTDYSVIVPEDLNDSINALGYATSADTICKRVYHIPVTPGVQPSFNLSLPLCYAGCDDIIAHVYIDGFMIDNEHIRYKKNKQFVHIDILDGIQIGPYGCNMKSYVQYWNDLEIKETAYFTVEIFEGTPYRAKKITVPAHGTADVVVDQDYLVYLESPVDSINRIQSKTIYKRFSPKFTYREMTKSEYQTIIDTYLEGPYRKLTFKNMSASPRTYLVVSKNAYAKICGVEHQLKEMNYDIFCTHLLTVDALEFPDLVDGEIEETQEHIKIPYLNKDQSVLTYLNHRELTRGLDYQIYQINGVISSQYAGQFIVFQNVDYLTVANNIFEAYCISEAEIISTHGFLTDGSPTLEGYLASYANTGVLFADGRAVSRPPSTVVGVYDTNLHHSIRKGAEAKIRAYIPTCLKSIFDKYAKYDPSTLTTVLNYMNSISVDTESPAILERSHHIYSIFLQTITEEVLRGRLKYDLSWTENKIRQVLKMYEDLIDFDIGLGKPNVEVTDPNKFIQPPVSGLDYRFVDVLPTYRLDTNESDLVVHDKYPVVRISDSLHEDINGSYICMNSDLSFIRPGERYCEHTTDGIVRKNYEVSNDKFNDRTQEIWQNTAGCMISHIGPHWVLLDSNNIMRAKAWDPRGEGNIWSLAWESMDDTTFQISTTEIEIHTAGEFPARRIAYTTNISDRNFLTKVARMYLNKDLVADGVNIQ